MSLTPVPCGEVATIVTSLEMVERPKPRPLAASPLRLIRWSDQAPEKYRALFRRIGGPWLWFSRLVLDDTALSAIIHDDQVSLFAIVDRSGLEVGIVELDFRSEGQCELAFIGLIPELTGKGLGGWLMAQALALAWRKDVVRVWVHTCTLDHPSALGFYQKSGFVAFETLVEIFPDPRITGILPRNMAPHVPLLERDDVRLHRRD